MAPITWSLVAAGSGGRSILAIQSWKSLTIVFSCSSSEVDLMTEVCVGLILVEHGDG